MENITDFLEEASGVPDCGPIPANWGGIIGAGIEVAHQLIENGPEIYREIKDSVQH